MPSYFRNLEETLESQNGVALTPMRKVRRWAKEHLRLLWNLVMMVILLSICFWATYFVSQRHDEGTIIEKLVPEIMDAKDVDAQLEKAAKSLQ